MNRRVRRRILVVVGFLWPMGFAALEARAQFGVPITPPATGWRSKCP
jgi:hypothetical protein